MVPLWGIDLGGTKIEGVVLDGPDTMNVLCRMRVPTEASKGYTHVLRQIQKLVETMMSEVGMRPTRIGMGTPGSLDPQTQTLKNSNTVCLNGKPFQRDVEALLKVPVRIANDANCFALAEARWGAVKEHLPEARVVFGVIMGTGVGGGIVVDGKVLDGRQGIAGEWGHNFLDASGGPCYCGREGCVETVLSGPALERYYASRAGERLPLKEVVARHKAGTDPHATATMDRLVKQFGRAIAYVINILDPDAIVLGGGVSNIDLLYEDGVAEAEQYVFNTHMETVFLRPTLGDSAGVFGAALL